ncbi:MAG TPA: sensor histidine kinase [Rhizomicrobium sp.]|nr:sensor histidine kinase [Rhizomicrobium sp.]
MERARADAANVHDRVLQSAASAAGDEESLLSSGEQITRALSHIADVRDASADCDGILSDVLIGVKYFGNISRIDANGNVVCSALPLAKGRTVRGTSVFKRARETKSFVISGQTQSAVLRSPVIAGLLPLYDATGKFDGAVSIVLEIHWLDFMVRARGLPKGAVVFIYDHEGHVLASNDMKVAAALAGDPSARGQTGSLHSGTDAQGRTWSFGSSALRDGAIQVGFAMQESRLFGPTYLHVGTDFLMPILMIGLAWAGIWFATERQVTQWIAYLRRISAAYRSGHYSIRPQLEGASPEFAALGEGLAEMAEAVQERDKSLRDALAQKSLLIREIHHRVKNNLQIVMSLLSLQAGQITEPQSKEALMQAQARINALALVHRILHEIEDQTTIDLTRLLHELTHQLVEGMNAEKGQVQIVENLVQREVPGDIAVPLALFTVEALTNVFKYAFPNGQGGTIALSLVPVDGSKLKLTISDNGVGYIADGQKTGIGARLIRTFGQQIGGVSTLRTEPGKGTTVDVVFRDPDKLAA